MRGLDGLLVASVSITLGAACGDTFGESRLRLHTTTDASLLWEQSFDVERVYVPSATAEGALLVLGGDDCWGRDFISEYDKATGEKLRDLPAAPLPPPASYDPPPTCRLRLERATLSNGDEIDICEQDGDSRDLDLIDVATGTTRATIPGNDVNILVVAGDYLFIRDDFGRTVDAVALEPGEVLWHWESPGDSTVLGADADRAYLWEYDGDVHALALADGTPIWNQRLDCNWITLAGDVLACDQKLSESSCRDTDRLWYLGPSHP